MKKSIIIPLVGLAALALTAGCKEEPQVTAQPAAAEQQSAQPSPNEQASGSSPGVSGTVTETMDTAGYSYVQVDTGEEKIWAAAPKFNVKVGDPVIVPEGMVMSGFHSDTLNRDFDKVYFVNSIMVGGEQPVAANTGMPQGHPPINTDAVKQNIDFSGIGKADQTVQGVYAEKENLAGKEITVRGKVVKFSPAIMNKNWIHVQDGTGADGTNDLTVTTDATAKVGDTVLVQGVLTTDKDFGAGYQYAVILEDAQVTVE